LACLWSPLTPCLSPERNFIPGMFSVSRVYVPCRVSTSWRLACPCQCSSPMGCSFPCTQCLCMAWLGLILGISGGSQPFSFPLVFPSLPFHRLPPSFLCPRLIPGICMSAPGTHNPQVQHIYMYVIPGRRFLPRSVMADLRPCSRVQPAAGSIWCFSPIFCFLSAPEFTLYQ
jgi:hypothetical protein